jgi:hypothetical protein
MSIGSPPIAIFEGCRFKMVSSNQFFIWHFPTFAAFSNGMPEASFEGLIAPGFVKGPVEAEVAKDDHFP